LILYFPIFSQNELAALAGSQEYQKLHDLNKKQSTVLVVGAGFIGVEWAARSGPTGPTWPTWPGRFRKLGFGSLVEIERW
jgi:hypothetical protein